MEYYSSWGKQRAFIGTNELQLSHIASHHSQVMNNMWIHSLFCAIEMNSTNGFAWSVKKVILQTKNKNINIKL